MSFRGSLYFALGVMLLLALDAVGSVAHATTLPLQQGGTGLTSTAAGDLLIGTTSKAAYSILHVGADGYTLQASSTASNKIVWAAVTSGSGFATTSANYWLSTKSTTDLPQGTNLYYTDAHTQTYLDTLGKGYFFSTTSASYFLSLNQSAAFSTTSASYFLSQNQGPAYATTSANYWLSTKSTSNVSEGANLYYTDARVAATIDASTTIPHIGGSAWGDMLQWNGSAWATTSTSTLGISGGASLVGNTGNVAYFSGTNTAVGTSSITIDVNGHAGIGTTTPIKTFTVVGDSSGGDALIVRDHGAAGASILGTLGLEANTTDTNFTALFGPSLSFYVATSSSRIGTPGIGEQTALVGGLAEGAYRYGLLYLATLHAGSINAGTLMLDGFNNSMIFGGGSATLAAFNLVNVNSVLDVFDAIPTGGSAALTVKNSGRVGVSSSTPGTTLSVGGSTYMTGGAGVGVLNTVAGSLVTTGAATIGGNISGLDTSIRQLTTVGDNTLGGFLNIGNRINTYDNYTTRAPGVVPIIFEKEGDLKSAAVASTFLFTDPNQSYGFYRICGYLNEERAGSTSSTLGGANLGMQVSFRNYDTGATSTTPAAISGATNAGNTVGSVASSCVLIHQIQGNGVYFTIGYTSSGATTMQYSYHIIVELLDAA